MGGAADALVLPCRCRHFVVLLAEPIGESQPRQLAGQEIYWPHGLTTGGSSTVNGMIYVRGHARDYDRWAELGAQGWSAADVWPYFRRMETFEDGASAYRGDSGPIHVERNRMRYPIVDAYIDAAVACGIPRNPDHNGALSGEGTDYAQATLEREWRQSLEREHGVTFDRLFVLNNMPISRFLEWLEQSGNLEGYMQKLVAAFNPAAVSGVMCRNTLSVGYDGRLYDCDFNQMLEMELDLPRPHVSQFDEAAWRTRTIATARHCFGCTAGAGSSCGGQTA